MEMIVVPQSEYAVKAHPSLGRFKPLHQPEKHQIASFSETCITYRQKAVRFKLVCADVVELVSLLAKS